MKISSVRTWWAVGALLVALATAGLMSGDLHRHALHAGDRFVALPLSSISGQDYTLSARRPMLINIFATWCTPCREETPGLAAAAKRLEREGVEVVGIDQEENAAQVERFAQTFALPYRVYIDTTGITHDLLGAHVIPTTIYVGADGRIKWMHAGPLSANAFSTLALQPGIAG